MKKGKELEIKSALEKLHILHTVLSEEDDLGCFFDEDDEELKELMKDSICGFLTKSQEKIIESLCKLPSHRWDSKRLCKGYLLLEEHKEYLTEAEVDMKEIEKPDFTVYELSQNNDAIKVGKNNTLIIDKKISDNFEEIVQSCCSFIEFKINLNNIVELWKLQNDNKIILNNKVLYIVNLYINNVNHEKENCLLDFPSYEKTPLPFQHTGILFGLLNKKILIADEMGLGKTIQALGILAQSNSFPAIVVCPKSLKYKWLAECSFLTNKKIEIVDSKTDFNNIDKDIYIINYENVRKYIDILETKKEIKAVIFDECHYLKNSKTKRSKSCLRLVKYKKYVIELSGSPVLNRPSELINQIEVLGRLEEFNGYQSFVDKYCINEKELRMQKYKNQKDYSDEVIEFDETPNYEVLAEKLRSSFYIRREKKEILKDLPPKFRTIIPVEINNKLEYKRLLKNYKLEKDLKSKKRLLEDLKETACKGKFDSIVERINDHIENKEKVVVFAYHKKMQEELLTKFPDALKIVSSQNEFDRNNNADRFQNEEDKYIIICSISVAYYGFDLYAASQVLFAEMDWVPMINIQCEDRTHRIGQKDSVNVWYMVAKDTVEEQIVKVNKEKMETIDQINKNVEMPTNNNIKNLVMNLI
jgi:SWI/SNF-related matrix-associated actin-dependent regulator 1 of chromatin subfamily A